MITSAAGVKTGTANGVSHETIELETGNTPMNEFHRIKEPVGKFVFSFLFFRLTSTYIVKPDYSKLDKPGYSNIS